MKVVILAAGEGKRLLPLTKEKPKCMIEIMSKPILGYVIEGLHKLGVDYKDIVIVTGHKREIIERFIPQKLNTIFNPDYKAKNNIYSVFILKEAGFDDILLLNSDVLFHLEIMKTMIEFKGEAGIMVAFRDKLSKEDMKVICKKGHVLSISKSLSPESSHGEYIGMARFKGEGLKRLFLHIDEIVRENKTNEWYERAFDTMAKTFPIICLSTRGLPWIEIDTHKDLERAKEVLEKIRRECGLDENY